MSVQILGRLEYHPFVVSNIESNPVNLKSDTAFPTRVFAIGREPLVAGTIILRNYARARKRHARQLRWNAFRLPSVVISAGFGKAIEPISSKGEGWLPEVWHTAMVRGGEHSFKDL